MDTKKNSHINMYSQNTYMYIQTRLGASIYTEKTHAHAQTHTHPYTLLYSCMHINIPVCINIHR